MICTKRILLLFLLLTLFSCSEKAYENPFDKTPCLKGIFSSEGKDFPVTVTKKDNTVSVLSDYGIEFVFDGASAYTKYGELEFRLDFPKISLFYPLYEMASGVDTTFKKGVFTHIDGHTLKVNE